MTAKHPETPVTAPRPFADKADAVSFDDLHTWPATAPKEDGYYWAIPRLSNGATWVNLPVPVIVYIDPTGDVIGVDRDYRGFLAFAQWYPHKIVEPNPVKA